MPRWTYKVRSDGVMEVRLGHTLIQCAGYKTLVVFDVS